MKKLLIFLVGILPLFLSCENNQIIGRSSSVLIVSDPLWAEYYADENIRSEDFFIISEESTASLVKNAQNYEIEDNRPLLISPLLSSALEDVWYDDIQRRVYYFLPLGEEATLNDSNAIPIHIDIEPGLHMAGRTLEFFAKNGSDEDIIPIFVHQDFPVEFQGFLLDGVTSVNPERRVVFVRFAPNDYSQYMFDEYRNGYSDGAGIFLGKRTSIGVNYWTLLGEEVRYITIFTGEGAERQSLGSVDFKWNTLMNLLDESVFRGSIDPIELPTILK